LTRASDVGIASDDVAFTKAIYPSAVVLVVLVVVVVEGAPGVSDIEGGLSLAGASSGCGSAEGWVLSVAGGGMVSSTSALGSSWVGGASATRGPSTTATGSPSAGTFTELILVSL